MNSPAPLLVVENLSCAYGRTVAVRQVSLTVGAGEIVALLGSNGAGKSTTVKAIAGVHPPKSGVITFDNTPITGEEAHVVIRRGITLVPEGRLIFAQMTVLENLQMGGHTQPPSEMKQLIEENLATFPRLAERRQQLAGSMSGGEQQQLAIARGLMSRPRLMIFDEPSLGLMPSMTQELFRLIAQINKRGVSVLLVEQNLHQALSVAHRGYVLEKGEVVLSESGEELLANKYVQRAFLGR